MTKINLIKNRLIMLVLAVIVLLLCLGGAAFAHVTVKPSEVATASYQIFAVSVPNEKSIPTESVRLDIPEALKSVTPTQKAGWEIEIEKEGSGENTVVKSVTWKGGEISDGMRDEFTFSAKTPDAATELQWKAYQTYADGTVVSWDQEREDGHGHDTDNPNQGPFSVTRVADETEQAASVEQAARTASDAKAAAERALFVAVAGVVLGLASVYVATRKKTS